VGGVGRDCQNGLGPQATPLERWERSLQEEMSVRQDQSVSQMTEEVLMRQAKALSHRSGQTLEDASQAVSETEAGRQLRDLANGEHRHEKARSWQAGVFWDRAEERMMRLYCSEALSRIAAEGQSTGD
jgi:hypothetical protein